MVQVKGRIWLISSLIFLFLLGNTQITNNKYKVNRNSRFNGDFNSWHLSYWIYLKMKIKKGNQCYISNSCESQQLNI